MIFGSSFAQCRYPRRYRWMYDVEYLFYVRPGVPGLIEETCEARKNETHRKRCPFDDE